MITTIILQKTKECHYGCIYCTRALNSTVHETDSDTELCLKALNISNPTMEVLLHLNEGKN